jgi:hypothetical protein
LTVAHEDRPAWDIRHAPRLRLIILAFLALFLVWEILTRSLTAYLAAEDPEAALVLRSSDTAALLNVADDTLARDETIQSLDPVLAPSRNPVTAGSSYAKGEEARAKFDQPTEPRASGSAYAPIQSAAVSALMHDPLNARAFRILGQISDLTADEEQTKALMQAAVRRSLRESIAVYWMMRKSYHDGDYGAALGYADTLLRTRAQAIDYVMPLLGKIAELPEASDNLKRLLAGNPPWRPKFFDRFPANITDARTPLDVLLTLRDTPHPPTDEDLGAYLNFLIQHKFYELAYYTWLQFLPPEALATAGHLFNGNFASSPSGLPFDWVLTKGSGVTVQIAAKQDQPQQKGLFLQFGPGRVDYHDVTQLVILSPGAYKFKGAYKSDLVSERGLEWRVVCAGGQGGPIGQSAAVRGSTQGWTDFEFSFTVPPADCTAQYVKLVFDARSASEQFISGSVWYGDLKIVRDPGTTSDLNP